ncbi:MAG: transposase, partial [Bacilli bacterium]
MFNIIYIGIDISIYKHDCCIIKDTGEFIVENLTFLNNQTGFQSFLELLKSYDKSLIKIALEATEHYGLNLKLFLEYNNLLFMEFIPVLVKQFKDSKSLRRTKTNKVDSY